MISFSAVVKNLIWGGVKRIYTVVYEVGFWFFAFEKCVRKCVKKKCVKMGEKIGAKKCAKIGVKIGEKCCKKKV